MTTLQIPVSIYNMYLHGFNNRRVTLHNNHDRAIETLLKGARLDGQANVSPPYTEHPTETSSVVESYDASAVRHA